jgi:hypothetical protein
MTGTPMTVSSRFVTTSLLVLIALGGAGLAVAADREQTSFERPELTWAADHAAQPYIATLAGDVAGIGSSATDLAKAGRDTLGNLQSLKLDAVRTALAAGDDAASKIGAALPDLSTDHDAANAAIQRWRIGPETGAQLDAIDAAVTSAPQLQDAWTAVEARATAVMTLVGALQAHDSSVFQAATAGRQQQWAAALTALGSARDSLTVAHAQRDLLAASATVDTLDQVLARYGAYDDALTNLYEYMGSGGAQSGTRFDTLNKAVMDAQSALPADTGVYSIIVGDAAGTAITDALVQLEQARGAVNVALDATTGKAPAP